MDDAAGTDVHAATFLTRLADEAERAAAACEEIEAFIAEASRRTGASATMMRQAQALDLLRQHVAAIATTLQALSDEAPRSWLVHAGRAVAGVTLSDVAARLSGAETLASDADADVTFF